MTGRVRRTAAPRRFFQRTFPQGGDNWDAKTVFVDGAYQAPDIWYGKNGETFHPGLRCCVGGNSKVYGSALFHVHGQHGAGAAQRPKDKLEGLPRLMGAHKHLFERHLQFGKEIPIVMVLEMDFLDLHSIHASLASPIKTEAHGAALEVLKPFSGRFFHFIAESRPLGAGSKG